jgi:hypothetical protein
VAARVGIPLALPQVGLALLAAEAHRDTRNCRERILGSGVNARDYGGIRRYSGLEEILGLVIVAVGQVVETEIQLYSLADLFGHAKIQNSLNGCQAARDFGFAEAGAMQFPNLCCFFRGGCRPPQTLSILAGVVQSGAHPLPQNLAFACRKLTDLRHPCITNPRYFSNLTTGLISSM